MKLKKLILCLALLLPMCSCSDKSHQESSVSEKTYTNSYVIKYHLNSDLCFDTKLLNWYKISDFSFDLDFLKFGIDFDTLLAGDTIMIETNRIFFMQLANKKKGSKGYNEALEVLNISVKKANIIPLKISKTNDGIQLINEFNPSVNYHLHDYPYTLYDEDTPLINVDCVFNSLNAQYDYTLLKDLSENEVVYGSYLEGELTSNECLLYALYSFNPSE